MPNEQEMLALIKTHVDASDGLLKLCKTLSEALDQVSAKVTILEMYIREVEAKVHDVCNELKK